MLKLHKAIRLTKPFLRSQVAAEVGCKDSIKELVEVFYVASFVDYGQADVEEAALWRWSQLCAYCEGININMI